MKTFSKVLSMFLVVVMCFGLFATSAFADFDFGGNNNSAAGYSDGFDFGGSSAAFSDNFALNEAPAQETYNDSFALKAEEPEQTAEEPAVVEQTEEVKEEASNAFDFASSNTATFNSFEASNEDTFNTKYSDMTNPTFIFSRTTFTKTDTADITVKSSSGKLTGDTFSNGFAYSTSATGSNLTALTQGAHYALNDDTLTLYNSWLKTLAPNVYYIYGRRIDDVPVKLGFINVNAGNYAKAGIANSPYVKPALYSDPAFWPAPITATATSIAQMNGFGVAAVSGSYTHILTVNEYSVAGNVFTFANRYLNNLEDGEYYLIGFPTEGSTSDQANLGKFIVKSGNVGGIYTLTPSGQVWYSGTDPLTFYSEIHDLAGNDWNYKGYGIDVFVPDIIYSTNSSMRGATSVRIDQYWDLGYGYIMLGQNFLSSLSPEETYYMQVIDAREPDVYRSEVVTFRVGPTLRAIDTDKHVINSTRSLRFRSSSPVSEVYVGNIPLTDPADYGVSWDGKTVTLSFEFLNKRSPGNTYTIKVRTADGTYASTTFQILSTAQGSASPRTGDESNLGLWAAFLLLSGTAVVVLVPKLRKHDI
jgi:hypothetical protein